jgi:DNA-binding NarL/FixJ family response regulator
VNGSPGPGPVPVPRDPDQTAASLDGPWLSADDAHLPARVLIVDDAPVFREVARELLERRGYAVVGEAHSAASAIDLNARLRPDAVLMDIRLPDGDGFELCADLVRADPDLAVLLVSADRAAPSPARVAASGARGFVLKSRLATADLEQFWPSQSRA